MSLACCFQPRSEQSLVADSFAGDRCPDNGAIQRADPTDDGPKEIKKASL
jgi:hypothetical protein